MTTLHDLPNDWQHKDIEEALKHVKNFGLAVDVGAHRGIITSLLCDRFENVTAIEPTDLAFSITKRAEVLHYAIGAVPGRVAMQEGKHNTGQTHVVSGDGVPMFTLDDLFSPGGRTDTVDFIKIDVEGMELDVLRGGERTIKACKPVIMFEENGLCKRYGHAPGAAGALLEEWGATRVLVLRSNAPDEDWVYTWI